jgi:hypothetical protein
MDKNASPFATQEQVLALLARPVREVTIAKDETPLESVLASLTSFSYEKEEGMIRVENVEFKHVAISAKTGKQYATFKTSDGKYKSFFTAQIQL